MSTFTPDDPKELRPLLHERIDRWGEEDLRILHRVMLELERDRVLEGVNADFDQDRERGRLDRVPEMIREARAVLTRRAADAA